MEWARKRCWKFKKVDRNLKYDDDEDNDDDNSDSDGGTRDGWTDRRMRVNERTAREVRKL